MRVTSRKIIHYQGRTYLREVCRHPGVLGLFPRGMHAVILTGARKDMWIIRPRLSTITG
jgi:hypothetical protein